MAQIRPYEPGVSAEAPIPGRSPERLFATSEDFGGGEGMLQAGKGLQDAGQTLYDTAQTDETQAVTTELAKKRAKWTVELQKRSTSDAVDDPHFAEKFNEDMQNDLAGLGSNLSTRGGQQAFQRGSAELTGTLLTNASAAGIHAAGARAVNSATETMNANISTLTLDPTQFGSILTDTDAALHDPNGPYATMPSADREKLGLMAKEQYAFATARAYIRQDPQSALEAFNAGKLPGQQYLKNQTGSEVVQLANSAINASRIKRIQQDADIERQQRIGAEDAGRNIFDSFLKNPGDTTLTDKVYNDKNMTWEVKNSLLGAMGRSAKPMADHDANSYGDGFYNVLHSVGSGADLPSKTIYDMVGPRQNEQGEVVDGPLTMAGAEKIIALQQSKRTPEGSAEALMKSSAFEAVKKQLSYAVPGLNFKDPKGEELNSVFLQHFLPAYDAAKQGGEKPQDLLNFQDPKSLISTSLSRYKRSLTQIQQDMAAESSGLFAASTAEPKAEDFKTADDVSAAYKAGKINRDTASQFLIKNGWAQ